MKVDVNSQVPEPEDGQGIRPPTALTAPEKKKHFRRTRRLFGHIPHPPVHSARWTFMVILTTAVIIGGGVFFAMWFVPYSESASFCTTCHTMIPQKKAYEAGAHADVACGECHVTPTPQGWISAKLAGTNELKALITNTYPTPIPPIEHSKLPTTQDTCMKCHQLERINEPGNPIKLILRPRYQSNEANTMDMVAVAVRPTGLGSSLSADPTAKKNPGELSHLAVANLEPRGVHWHVATNVEMWSTDEQLQTIPLVEYTNEDGVKESFISTSEVGLATDVSPDIQRLKATTDGKTVDCLECHNMVGHNIPEVGQQIDKSIENGDISQNIPFVKRNALEVLEKEYGTQEDAFAAIDALGVQYTRDYPLMVQQTPDIITKMTESMKVIYDETATPAMATTSTSYPDNLGHQRSPGCFRCHDGTHVKVVDGKATDQVIPSTCSTCHTFPQVGQEVSGLQLGVPPESHQAKLYVFNHKTSVTSVDEPFTVGAPANANCATCHQKAYCDNCHNSGAIKVTHDEMLFNHKASIQKGSPAACAYCHQPIYCATCHADPVMPSDTKLPQIRLG